MLADRQISDNRPAHHLAVFWVGFTFAIAASLNLYTGLSVLDFSVGHLFIAGALAAIPTALVMAAAAAYELARDVVRLIRSR